MTDIIPPTRLDCGKTIEELADYVAENRTPRDPHIERCPECANVIEALERVSHLSHQLLRTEALALEPVPDSWINQLLGDIEAEIITGRSHALPHPDPRVQLFITENAIKSHLRTLSDELGDIILGRCDIEGDLGAAPSPAIIHVSASAATGVNIPHAADRLRHIISDAVATHTGHRPSAIHVTITDIHTARTP